MEKTKSEDILILGAGRVGGELAAELSKSYNVTVVDTQRDKLHRLQTNNDLRIVQGNAANPKLLEEANIHDASTLIAVTASDEVNLVACKICAQLDDADSITRIARVRSPHYDEKITREAFNISTAFCPEEIVAKNIANAIAFPGCLSVNHFAGGRLVLAGMRVSAKGDIIGGTIGDLRQLIEREIDYRIVSIYRDEDYVPPQGEERLFMGDEVYLLAAADTLNKIVPAIAGQQTKNRNIFIAGGGNIGERVAAAFADSCRVKVLERDIDRAAALTKNFSALGLNVQVLKGRASDEDILKQEEIGATDIFCALTNDDEENVLSALLAKKLGAKKTALLVNRGAYVSLLERQIDILISPSKITIGAVLAAVMPAFGTVHFAREGNAEAVEFTVHGDEKTSNIANREIQQISFPDGIIPGALIRDDNIFIVHDNTVVMDQDRLICFATCDAAVKAMTKFIKAAKEHIA